MVANPYIRNVIATKSGGTTKCMVFISNDSSSGMVKTIFYEYASSTCQPGGYSAGYNCIPNTYTYIEQLNYRVVLTTPNLPAYVCAKTFQCTSGENCGSLLCSVYNAVPFHTKDGIYVDYGLGITPSAATNLNATVSSTAANIKWTPATNTLVTYHYVSLWQGATNLIPWNSWVIYNQSTGLNISSLTNGLTYRVYINALSDDGIVSTDNTYIDFVPNAPCISPSCNVALT